MRKIVYPMQYDYMVRYYSYENHVEPSMVAAVILAESKFKEDAASGRGANGLMQIMPDTGKWIAEQMDMNDYSPDKLSDVRTNIRMGTWYLAYLLKEFDGNQILALAAYNAGRGHVDAWMKQYGWNKDFSEIEKIPFSETREYVKVVLQNESQYKKLYDF
jgi:soluble lytic murein transglycosylase